MMLINIRSRSLKLYNIIQKKQQKKMQPKTKRNQKSHTELTQQKMQENNDQQVTLHRPKTKTSSFSQQSGFKMQKMLLWIPVLAGIIFITFGVVRQTLKEEEHFYCFKRAFIPDTFPTLLANVSREFKTNTRYQFQMFVDAYDANVSKTIVETGSYQPAVISLIGHIFKEGDSVLVAGSHIGLQALVAGHVIDSKGKLYIFQPRQFHHKLIQKSIKQNKLQKTTTLYKSQPSSRTSKDTIQQISQIRQKQKQKQKQNSTSVEYVFSYINETITLDRIDNILPNHVNLNFAYINMDGNGVKALIGMIQTIKRSQNLVILIKWQAKDKSGIRNEAEETSLFKFLSQRGYKSYSYKGGSYRQSCSVGQFTLRDLGLDNYLDNYNKKQQMLVLFPDGYQLPR